MLIKLKISLPLHKPFLNLILSKAISPCFQSVILASNAIIKPGGFALNSTFPKSHLSDWLPCLFQLVSSCPWEFYYKIKTILITVVGIFTKIFEKLLLF